MAKKKQLYFDETTTTQLESLPDALNRTLYKDDFVTAVFKDGELTLFKIINFEKTKIDHYINYERLDYDQHKGVVLLRSEENQYVVLQRVRGTNAYSSNQDDYAQKLNEKLVYKTSKQVAYADPNYVLMHYLTI